MDQDNLNHAVDRIVDRIDATLAQPGAGFPHYADPADGVWVRTPGGDWTGGFWCGLLWLAAHATQQQCYRCQARGWARQLRPRVASNSVFKGFLFWYGVQLGAELFEEAEMRDLATDGARGLAQMYNAQARLIPLGTEAEEASDVGVHEANIDALPGTVRLLLTHAGSLGTREIAVNHLRQHVALCVRDDGSICQSATFEPRSGALVRRYTHKGFAEDSTWARAQAWGMLGLAQALGAGEVQFRDDASRVADWWITNVAADHVAFWDFDDPSIPSSRKDTSATAIAAASLLKLAALIPTRAELYRAEAQAAVERLVERHLTPASAEDMRQPGMLVDGCFNQRTGLATAHELIWGDYFLLEALLVLTGRVDPNRA